MKPRIRLVVIGLSLSSSWGNGHATTYRALLRSFAARGHDVLFLEHDAPWYAQHRDLPEPDFCELRFYGGPDDLEAHALAIADADAVIVGSYVDQGIAVGRFVQERAGGVTAFYDIDTPVTMAALENGECSYLTSKLVAGYDLYLSFTGGPMLSRIERVHGSKAARALYCSVDHRIHQPRQVAKLWDLSYLGTYSPDRQPTLERLLLEPARRNPQLRFAVAGPQYPREIAWPANVERFEHVGPADHPAFYAASRFTLNVTRADMIEAGWSPSVRLFEAAACGTPLISDAWAGLDRLFRPGEEILIAESAADVEAALTGLTATEAADLGRAARHRVLANHTADHRAADLERFILQAMTRSSSETMIEA